MFYSATKYFNYVRGDNGRNSFQKWTEGSKTMYLQGYLPRGDFPGHNATYFAKKHLLTINPPRNASPAAALTMQEQKGQRVAAKRADFSTIKVKAGNSYRDRYGRNEAEPLDGITFVFCQSLAPAVLREKFFDAVWSVPLGDPGDWEEAEVDFGSPIVRRITKTGTVTETRSTLYIGFVNDGNGNFAILHGE